MDMREYIAQRLDAMTSTAEKDLLREYMEGIFIPLYDHVEGEYREIQRRVKAEMPLLVRQYAVWTTVMEREKADGGSPYLFPMLEEDTRPPTLELDGLQQRLRAEKEIPVDTILLETDYLTCKQVADNRQVFDGLLRVEGAEYRVGVRLRPAKRYIACLERLYRLFISNIVPWQTVNCPYLFKLFDVMLVRLEEEVVTGIAGDIQVSYGELEKHVRRGLVPVWNIRKLRIKSEDFPLAALDKVNYEYNFDLEEYGTEHGYLADYGSADIAAVRREENALIVTSPSAKGLAWDMYRVTKKEDFVTDSFRYELMNNRQAESFGARMLAHYGTMIKTKGELIRVLSAYDASRFVQLVSFQIMSGNTVGETYEVNGFLADEVRDLAVSKSILLRFKPLVRNHFLLRDEMSFLTSQVQLIYPEFHCVGVLI